jgi:hypothetical protein
METPEIAHMEKQTETIADYFDCYCPECPPSDDGRKLTYIDSRAGKAR